MIVCTKCGNDVVVRRMTMHLFDGVLRYFCDSKCKEQYLKECVERESKRVVEDVVRDEA